VKFHVHATHAADLSHTKILPELQLHHNGDCWHFCISISGPLIFREGGRYIVLYKNSGWVKIVTQCYIRWVGVPKKTILRYMIRERCHDTGLNCGWRRQRTLLWSRQQGYRVTLVWVYTSQWISVHLVTVSHALACRLCCIHRCTRLAIGAKSRSVNWNYAFSHATDRRAKHRYQPTHEWMAASCQTT